LSAEREERGPRPPADGVSARLVARFARADALTGGLRERAGLACPPGCGACCLSPEVETTALELRPLARELARAGRAGALLAELARRASAGDARCVLYAPEPGDARRGRCTAYGLRPLVCRLFGFAARRDRAGRLELVACRTMRAWDPAAVSRAERDVAAGGTAAVLPDEAHALAAEFPDAGARRLPINAALARALERELLRCRLRALERRAGDEHDGPRPRPVPRRPRRPRRAA